MSSVNPDWWWQWGQGCPPARRPVADAWADGPTLADVKLVNKVDNDRDDAALQSWLDAAIAFVLSVRRDLNFTQDITDSAPAPSKTVFNGTCRLAHRWYIRHRSPDGLITMAELGASRIPSVDPDIERMLKVGRYKGPTFA